MEKVNSKSVDTYTDTIGNDGLVMNTRVETIGETKNVYATIVKNNKEVACASYDTKIIMSCSPLDLTAAEFKDFMEKTMQNFAEILGIELPE